MGTDINKIHKNQKEKLEYLKDLIERKANGQDVQEEINEIRQKINYLLSLKKYF